MTHQSPTTAGRKAKHAVVALAALWILLALLAPPSFAQSPGRASPNDGPEDVTAGNQATDTDGVRPAPPSTGANVPLEYFGPMASEVSKKLVGPVQLLRSGTLSRRRTTIELPLYRGHLRDGRSVWYILTDTTNKSNAEALGLNHSAKLRYSEIDSAVREGRLTRRQGLVFDSGGVDFDPDRRLVPGAGANAFPPRVNQPGSVGDRNYTLLVKITNAGGHIYNAPVVAFDMRADQIRACTGGVNHNRVHDRVVKICPTNDGGGTVTIRTTPIFSFAKPALYVSMDSSEPVTATLDEATLDEATLAPAIADVPVGSDDGALSAVERLFPIANGPEGRSNPQRQGLNSAIKDNLAPLQVIGGIPHARAGRPTGRVRGRLHPHCRSTAPWDRTSHARCCSGGSTLTTAGWAGRS